MLVIDDNKFKLAKMQETLLKVDVANRANNLRNYKHTVAEIDAKAFDDILEETKHIDEHNHSLEEELEFLETIKKAYEQLLELQLSFKRICETYGDDELKLSDLSKLNIEYIENRVNTISGYLINLKNIEVNKIKLQELNEQLIDEEKKKITLDKKLLDLDNVLKSNFISAEGRTVVDGNLQYTSVITEYDKIGLDFKRLLDDSSLLRSLLSSSEREKQEVSEKVKVAEVCYNSILTTDSKQILNEINFEFLKIKYKVAMLKIVEFLSQNSDSYDMFVKKRESILDLIKYRLACMESLGTKSSIDPFSRTKVREQLDIVLSLSDNSKIIDKIRKEISKLNSWTEEMLSQNNSYLITLNDTRKLIEDSIGLGDIDITSVVSFEELLFKQEVSDNQVISVRNIPNKLNMNIVNQKTSTVIERVNQMMSSSRVLQKQEEEIVPELVIVPATVHDNKKDDEVSLEVPKVEIIEPILLEENEDIVEEKIEEEEEVLEDNKKNDVIETVNFDIFETMTPFAEPSLFKEKVDDEDNNTNNVEASNIVEDIGTFSMGPLESSVKKEPDELVIEYNDTTDVMPEVFWITQEEVKKDEDNVISFDDQINALLSSENNDAGKIKRRTA